MPKREHGHIYNRLTDKVRDEFNQDALHVNTLTERIEVYWMKDPQGRLWIPNSGGPLYGEMAVDKARWIGAHLEEFRSLLPKQIREWPIVVGELDCRNFPGVFRVA